MCGCGGIAGTKEESPDRKVALVRRKVLLTSGLAILAAIGYLILVHVSTTGPTFPYEGTAKGGRHTPSECGVYAALVAMSSLGAPVGAVELRNQLAPDEQGVSFCTLVDVIRGRGFRRAEMGPALNLVIIS